MNNFEYTVLVPRALVEDRAVGKLFGYAHPGTRVFNIISCGQGPEHPGVRAAERIGQLFDVAPPDHAPAEGLIGYYNGSVDPTFQASGKRCAVELYSLVHDVFSRNSGILESSDLLHKRVIISGCGSVGSLMALELARSGVGHFLLIDNDRLAYHNICRHQCGIADVGRDKVEAVRERIWDINPTAEVTAVAQVLQRLTKDQLDVWAGPGSIIVGCADNRESDIYANRLSQIYGMPFVSIGLWERAFAGEIFWSIPSQTPCYLCMFGGQQNQLSFRQSENRRIYTTEYDASTVGFEPGISVDIGFVTDIGIKLVLDLIRRAEAPSRLLFSLKQFTLVCNTTRVRVPGDLQEMFDHPLQITRSIEVDGVPGCPHCALSLPIPEKGH